MYRSDRQSIFDHTCTKAGMPKDLDSEFILMSNTCGKQKKWSSQAEKEEIKHCGFPIYLFLFIIVHCGIGHKVNWCVRQYIGGTGDGNKKF